jgi:hypothetical protein
MPIGALLGIGIEYSVNAPAVVSDHRTNITPTKVRSR